MAFITKQQQKNEKKRRKTEKTELIKIIAPVCFLVGWFGRTWCVTVTYPLFAALLICNEQQLTTIIVVRVADNYCNGPLIRQIDMACGKPNTNW